MLLCKVFLSHSIHIPLLSYRRFGQRVFHYIFKETFRIKFFQETVETTFAFHQSSSYITQNIIVQMYCLVNKSGYPFVSYNVVLCKISQKNSFTHNYPTCQR